MAYDAGSAAGNTGRDRDTAPHAGPRQGIKWWGRSGERAIGLFGNQVRGRFSQPQIAAMGAVACELAGSFAIPVSVQPANDVGEREVERLLGRIQATARHQAAADLQNQAAHGDRKSVVEGKSVDLG